MRTSWLSVSGVLVLATLTGCTTKSVEIPVLAGPSTFARSLVIKAEKDTLLQNGQDTTRITVTALGPTGQSEAMNLRAQIFVDGVPQDFGTLSSKNFVTPATIIYTAPPASTTGVQPSHTVTIGFTPQDSGDFRGEFTRTIDLQIIPAGVILPSNPALRADFTVSPESPAAFSVATFDASLTTNGIGDPAPACRDACSYSWNFGDGTTGSGMITSHTFRAAGNFQVTLVVSDSRGSTATVAKTVTVTASPAPTAVFRFSPSAPGVNTDVFFNAAESVADRNTGRSIVRYDWNFGDGSTASGSTATHRFSAPGAYAVVLRVTDDVGSTGQVVQTITVTSGNPVASMTVTPNPTRLGQPTTFNASGSTSSAGSTITSYTFNYGDGSPSETSSSPIQTHVYGGTGVVTAVLTVTDSVGRTGTFTLQVTINP
jgi:PKD repeat protein